MVTRIFVWDSTEKSLKNRASGAYYQNCFEFSLRLCTSVLNLCYMYGDKEYKSSIFLRLKKRKKKAKHEQSISQCGSRPPVVFQSFFDNWTLLLSEVSNKHA